jgi:hypothetical protein
MTGEVISELEQMARFLLRKWYASWIMASGPQDREWPTFVLATPFPYDFEMFYHGFI